MKGFGFASSSADKCLYTKQGNRGMEVLVLVYVYDMAVATVHKQGVIWFKTELKKLFQIINLGKLKHILGIQIRCDCMSYTI